MKRLLLVAAALFAALAAPASAGLSGPPKYVPVPDGVIEHRVYETVIVSDGRPKEEPSSRTRRELWVASDRDRMVTTDLETGRVESEMGKTGGQIYNFSPARNVLTVYPATPGRSSLMTRGTETWIAQEELTAGATRVESEVVWNGRAALRLAETPQAVGRDGDGTGYRIVDAQTYELLETHFVTDDGGYQSTRRLVVSEDLPRAGNEQLLARPAYEGARVVSTVNRAASIAKKRAAKKKAKAKAKARKRAKAQR